MIDREMRLALRTGGDDSLILGQMLFWVIMVIVQTLIFGLMIAGQTVVGRAMKVGQMLGYQFLMVRDCLEITTDPRATA